MAASEETGYGPLWPAATLEELRQTMSGMSEPEQAKPVLDRSACNRIVLAFILPGALALCPILMPFGTPFAKDGENGIITNWAYYFWYTPIGWALLWLKMALWNCELFGQEFFFPFMQGRSGNFKATRALVPVLVTAVFSTALVTGGYLIFHNPVPLGTLTFFVPGFAVMFISMYMFLVPAASRSSWSDHIRIVRCWVPFVIWALGLTLYICVIWVKARYVGAAQHHTTLDFLMPMGIQALFIIIQVGLDKIPLKWLMGSHNEIFALLWNTAYGAMCACMSEWIFPEIPADFFGIASATAVMTVNVIMSLVFWWMDWRAKDLEGILHKFMSSLCDVIAGWAFIFVFVYSAYGPNQDFIYCISGLTREQKLNAVVMIGANFLVNIAKFAFMLQIARSTHDLGLKNALNEFGMELLRSWYWPVLVLLASTTLACGACMVMMHDGMDFSFTFHQWAGTWPFNHHGVT